MKRSCPLLEAAVAWTRIVRADCVATTLFVVALPGKIALEPVLIYSMTRPIVVAVDFNVDPLKTVSPDDVHRSKSIDTMHS